MNQKNRRQELYSLLGDLPSRDRRVHEKSRELLDRTEYHLERLVLDLNGMEDVPAYFIRPKDRQGERLPAILYSHAHGGKGKEEMLQGSEDIKKPPIAPDFINAGMAALCIDAWNWGERPRRDETDLFKETLWKGRTLWGLQVYDALKAFEYLSNREDVDKTRIGALGMSMGSTTTIWVSALAPAIKLCVDICCLTDFEELIRNNALREHSIYYFIPGLLKHFTMAQINELIAPRPHLSLAGLQDPLTPPKGLEKIDTVLRTAYSEMGAAGNWKLSTYDCGHVELPEMRQEIIAFLKAHL